MDEKDKQDLATVLHGQRREVDDVKKRAEALGRDEEMDDLLKESLGLLGKDAVEPESVEPIQVQVPAVVGWDQLVSRHDQALRADGVDLRVLTIDELLPPELNAKIEAEWARLWPRREPWRWWEDFAAVGAAGLAGGLLDLFLSKKLRLGGDVGKDAHDSILKDGSREFKERFGNEIKNPMSRHPIDAKIPGDLMGSARQDLHRAAGPGHDVCRIRESLDLMMGKQTDFSVAGQSVAEKTGGALRMMGLKGEDARIFNTFSDPEQASFALFLHWKADFFSSRGLPLPGTSYLMDMGGGPAGLAMKLYESGFSFWTLLAGLGKLSGVVVTELILRLHILIQRLRDGEKPYWSFSARNRYVEMFLVAHAIAAGVGAVAAVTTWNPAMLNFGAMIAATKNAIQLAYRLYKQRREALDRFASLVEQNNRELDELMVKATAGDVARLIA